MVQLLLIMYLLISLIFGIHSFEFAVGKYAILRAIFFGIFWPLVLVLWLITGVSENQFSKTKYVK